MRRGLRLRILESKSLNTPRLVADDTQKTVWRWEQQEPFGAGACNPDPDGDNVQFEFNLRFPGQYFDRETNLHYNWLRDYDAGSGRYIQSDPLVRNGDTPNIYSYAGNAPNSAIDSNGGWVAQVIVGATALYVGYKIPDAVEMVAKIAVSMVGVNDAATVRSNEATKCMSGDTAACNAAIDADKNLVPSIGEAIKDAAEFQKEIGQKRLEVIPGARGLPSSIAPPGNAPRNPVFPRSGGSNSKVYFPAGGRTVPSRQAPDACE